MKGKAFLFSAFLGVVLLLGSCDNEITSTELVVDESKTAALKLYVKAELDNTIEGEESVPDGTQFIVSVAKNDLNGNFTGDDRWVTTVSTTGGVLQVNVPATNDGITAYVDAVAFEATYEVNDTLSKQKVYKYNDQFDGITIGSNHVDQITMEGSFLYDIKK
jgi:hypothetical protein